MTVTIGAILSAESIAAQIPAKLTSYSIAFSAWTAGTAPAKGTIADSAKADIISAITGITGQDSFNITVKSIEVTTDPDAGNSVVGKANVVITVTDKNVPANTAETEAIEVSIANS